MPIELTEIETRRLKHILAMLKAQPGIPTRGLVEGLRAKGHKSANWDGVRREMGALRREGLAASRRHPGKTTYGWYPCKPGEADLTNLREYVVEMLKASPVPLTAAEIKDRVREGFDVRVHGKKVNNVMTALIKSSTSNVGIVDRIVQRSGGMMVNRYAYGTGEAQDKPEPIVLKRQFHWQPDELDDFRNQKTLETIPPDHLAAVNEAAESMQAFRANSRRISGGVFKPRYQPKPSRGCDAPIRDLFKHQRNDALEARYTALALWLSWKNDPHAAEAA
jgi:hypothetical protein